MISEYNKEAIRMKTGIEAVNYYACVTSMDVKAIFEQREGLDIKRLPNLLMEKRSLGLPCEDAVSNAVNAAKPIIDSLSESEKNRIELLIVGSESGVDFAKSLGTYVHDYLGLSRNCRLFEVKQACYAGTAALQMANSVILSNASPGAKALVIATDVGNFAPESGMLYMEPSEGTGAVAMLISAKPDIMTIDMGASGYYSYEVMDTCRPVYEKTLGDAYLSLDSYISCLKNSFKAYKEKIEDFDFYNTFDYFAFHSPFGGLVKGAHRHLMHMLDIRDIKAINVDFKKRLMPSLSYGTKVGNGHSASLYLALCGLIDTALIDKPKRIGMFSYGSGAASEFYSGTVTPTSKSVLAKMNIGEKLANRYALNMEEYEILLHRNMENAFNIKDKEIDISAYAQIYERAMSGKGLLRLQRVKNYHREYDWS
jgi:polyketide biosynthesis 3-hydroxy-3-methylglutaryl-CoA synthase-like enzyme PksG